MRAAKAGGGGCPHVQQLAHTFASSLLTLGLSVLRNLPGVAETNLRRRGPALSGLPVHLHLPMRLRVHCGHGHPAVCSRRSSTAFEMQAAVVPAGGSVPSRGNSARGRSQRHHLGRNPGGCVQGGLRRQGTVVVSVTVVHVVEVHSTSEAACLLACAEGWARQA